MVNTFPFGSDFVLLRDAMQAAAARQLCSLRRIALGVECQLWGNGATGAAGCLCHAG